MKTTNEEPLVAPGSILNSSGKSMFAGGTWYPEPSAPQEKETEAEAAQVTNEEPLVWEPPVYEPMVLNHGKPQPRSRRVMVFATAGSIGEEDDD